MKVGDLVKVKNSQIYDKDYTIMKVLKIYHDRIELQHPNIPGIFTYGKNIVFPISR